MNSFRPLACYHSELSGRPAEGILPGDIVLTKCANPICPSLFRHLSQGKLFQVETESSTALVTRRPLVPTRKSPSARHVQHYWLCDQCSPTLTLIFEKERGMITVPLPTVRKNVAAVQLRAVSAATGPARISGHRRGQ
jgi:hypothetical protein